MATIVFDCFQNRLLGFESGETSPVDDLDLILLTATVVLFKYAATLTAGGPLWGARWNLTWTAQADTAGRRAGFAAPRAGPGFQA